MHRIQTTDYFLESVQSRSQKNHSVEVKETPKILYPKKICYNNKGKLNFFQENTVSENLLPAYLHYKKYQRKFFVTQEENLNVHKRIKNTFF